MNPFHHVNYILIIGFGLLCRPIELHSSDFESTVHPFLSRYCIKCHGEEKTKGKVDFSGIRSSHDLDPMFETWKTAVELLTAGEMPPEDSKQPTEQEKAAIRNWYIEYFKKNVKAHPGTFRPRRLSASEYRNTLRSLFGFDLDVAIIEAEQTLVEKSMVLKLLPEDPPGPSGFKNDTSANPLTTLLWEQYSYIVDTALDELFSPHRKTQLQNLAGVELDDELSRESAGKLFRRFTTLAVRRPMEEMDLANRLRNLKKDQLEESLKSEMKVILMSPGFLYRGILVKGNAGRIEEVDSYELAERLSYFLWGDMPDWELLHLASQGELTDDDTLGRQVNRMLKSPKRRNLAEDFAVQWFALDDIDQIATRQLPVAVALKTQVIDFIDYLFRDNRPLMELIDSRTTFVSPLIAGFYKKDRHQLVTYRKQKGIELEIVPNQRIQMENTPERGGILTMPGILAMNKGPVIRGTWLLRRIMGEHLPEPPMDVGQVPANSPDRNLSFRQRFELHRSKPTCAVCHDKIDPFGFAFQRYDEKGTYIPPGQEFKMTGKGRKRQVHSGPIDTSGHLPTGESFKSFPELKQILLEKKRNPIIRNIVEQTLSYALCRKLELSDQPTVDQIVSALIHEQAGYHDLVKQVVNSLPFRKTYFIKNSQ